MEVSRHDKPPGNHRRGKRWGLGIGIGCLVVVFGALLLLFFAAFRMFGSATMPQAAVYAAPDAAGYLCFLCRPDDEALATVLGDLAAELSELNRNQQSGDLPEAVRPFLERIQGRPPHAAQVKQVMPIRVVLSYSYRPKAPEDERDQTVFAVDLAKYGRLIRFFVDRGAAADAASTETLHGYALHRWDSSFLTATGSGIVRSSQQDLLRGAVDRLGGNGDVVLPEPIQERMKGLSPGAPFRACLLNRDGALTHVANRLLKGDKEQSDSSAMTQVFLSAFLLGVQSLSCEATFQDPSLLTGTIYAACEDESTAEMVAMALYELRDRANEELAPYEAELSMDKSVDGGLLSMGFEFHGVRDFLVAKIRDSGDQNR